MPPKKGPAMPTSIVDHAMPLAAAVCMFICWIFLLAGAAHPGWIDGGLAHSLPDPYSIYNNYQFNLGLTRYCDSFVGQGSACHEHSPRSWERATLAFFILAFLVLTVAIVVTYLCVFLFKDNRLFKLVALVLAIVAAVLELISWAIYAAQASQLKCQDTVASAVVIASLAPGATFECGLAVSFGLSVGGWCLLVVACVILAVWFVLDGKPSESKPTTTFAVDSDSDTDKPKAPAAGASRPRPAAKPKAKAKAKAKAAAPASDKTAKLVDDDGGAESPPPAKAAVVDDDV